MRSMIPLVQERLPEVAELCRRYRVQHLHLFGSASRGTFDPGSSDLDILVEFEDLEPGQHADAFFGLLEALEELFGTSVDLIVESAIRNPYFREGALHSRIELYAA